MQLQQLATWGKVNAAVNDKSKSLASYRLDELVPLAVNRDGGAAWEYYFHFGGGSPPWTSSLSQGTAIQALIHASALLRNRSYASLAYQSLRLFQLSPPRGVRTRTGPGRASYVIYSFAPRYFVLNAFIQALNGLFDMGSPKLGKSAKARDPLRDRRPRGPARAAQVRHRPLGALLAVGRDLRHQLHGAPARLPARPLPAGRPLAVLHVRNTSSPATSTANHDYREAVLPWAALARGCCKQEPRSPPRPVNGRLQPPVTAPGRPGSLLTSRPSAAEASVRFAVAT